VASLAAEAFWRLRGGGPQLGSVLLDLLFGGAFGPFYYVPMIALFAALVPVLVRLRHAALAVAVAGAVALQLDCAVQYDFEGTIPGHVLFWRYRNPVPWGGYFLVGWLLGTQREAVIARLGRSRRVFAALAASGVLLAGGPPLLLASPAGVAFASWVLIWSLLAFLFALSAGRRGVPRALVALSETTYAIYLLHLFFVIPVHGSFHLVSGERNLAAILASWAAGLAGPLLVVAASRRLLGARSRLVVGA
jgi:surface polysaccharide O-acyltransferase-like enzyme